MYMKWRLLYESLWSTDEQIVYATADQERWNSKYKKSTPTQQPETLVLHQLPPVVPVREQLAHSSSFLYPPTSSILILWCKSCAPNQHLHSPAHENTKYLCPPAWNGCKTQFKTLSGLMQHVESETCGVAKFKQRFKNVVHDVTTGMGMLSLWILISQKINSKRFKYHCLPFPGSG